MYVCICFFHKTIHICIYVYTYTYTHDIEIHWFVIHAAGVAQKHGGLMAQVSAQTFEADLEAMLWCHVLL